MSIVSTRTSWPVLALVAGHLACTSAPSPEPADVTAIRGEFAARVDAYVRLHRELEETVPPLELSDDPARICAACDQLRGKIQAARAGERAGNVFTPAMAAHVREVVASSLVDVDIGALLADMTDDQPEVLDVEVAVNMEYPGSLPPGIVPPALLKELPTLPEELDYRFLGRNLILWDTHAGLLVDFVPDALPG